jgi:hypothetical protein
VVPVADAMAPIAAWWASQRAQPAPQPTVEHRAAAEHRHFGAARGRRY